MIKKIFTSADWEFSFIVRYPEVLTPGLPVIFHLHGSGERGNSPEELELIEQAGFARIFDKNELECILVEPQCPHGSFWVAHLEKLKTFIDKIISAYQADHSRIYLTGLSMGGYGTWFMAMAYPDIFAAIAPVCGGGMPWNGEVLKMPVWAFHGAKDKTVKPYESVNMVESVNQAGGNARLTMLQDVAHNAWDAAYTVELYDWLLSNKKSGKNNNQELK